MTSLECLQAYTTAKSQLCLIAEEARTEATYSADHELRSAKVFLFHLKIVY